jgi:hypothetical protein
MRRCGRREGHGNRTHTPPKHRSFRRAAFIPPWVSSPWRSRQEAASIDRNLGIDVNTATVTDTKGRPHYLVENGAQPIRELI